MERTFLMVKPDGVQRGLIGEIISRFEKKGFKLLAAKFFIPSRALVEQHYAEHKGKGFFDGLVSFLTSGPVLAMVWEGKNVIATSRQMMGVTNPANAACGTIRGDLAVDIGRNVIHGSANAEDAAREVALWFSPEEIHDWKRTEDVHIYE